MRGIPWHKRAQGEPPPGDEVSARWFLADASSSGMHEGALSFTASAPGTYQYPCPFLGHVQEGMAGIFVVKGTP